MSDEQTPDPRPQKRRLDDAITMTGLLKWGSATVSVAGFLVLCGMTYQTVRADITTLQTDVTALKAHNETAGTAVTAKDAATNARLDHIDRQLRAVICLLDKQKCADQLRTSIDP